MSAWLKRFGLHLTAAVGATGIFVAAAAVGAYQTQQQPTVVVTVPADAVPTRTPRRPVVSVATPTPAPGASATAATTAPTPAPVAPSKPAATQRVAPERSLIGTIQDVQPGELDVLGVGGRLWRVVPAPGALIRLNGKSAALDGLQTGDGVVILGQAGARGVFVAHAVTARHT